MGMKNDWSVRIYFLEISTMLETQADTASIRKNNWIAFGSIMIFFYFLFVSPPTQAFTIVDAFVIIAIVGCIAVVVLYEWHIEKSRKALLEEIRRDQAKLLHEKPSEAKPLLLTHISEPEGGTEYLD